MRPVTTLLCCASVMLVSSCKEHSRTPVSATAKAPASVTSTHPSSQASIVSLPSTSSSSPQVEVQLDASSCVGVDECHGRGVEPAGYSTPGLVRGARISLSDHWKVFVGDPTHANAREFDDSNWKEIGENSFWPVSRGKVTSVWMRRIFDLPSRADRSALALDLGARVGKSVAYLNGHKVGESVVANARIFLPAPLPLVEGRNVLALKVTFGQHVGGVRWTGGAALGQQTVCTRGLVEHSFRSSVDGTPQTLAVYLPRCADLDRPVPLVVALPGWNGNIWSFAHSKLLSLAETQGTVVVVPDPRGNVLYTGASEDGVLEAIDVVSRDLRIEPDRVYLTGVSMGGAGALQIGYHFPDRFAAIAAFYGDSRYDMTSYVRGILKTQQAADRYSVINFPENAWNLPVLLVHARDDRVSRVGQSEMLAEADRRLGIPNHLLVEPDTGGHTLQVVEDHLDEVMALFGRSRRVRTPSRVAFRTSAHRYDRAYWIRGVVKREGEFGEVVASFDAAARTIILHGSGHGLDLVRIDLGHLGLADPGPVHLRVERSLEASLILTGLGQGGALRIGRAHGPVRQIAVGSDGAATVGRLDEATYEMQILVPTSKP